MVGASLLCHMLLAAWLWNLPAADDLLPASFSLPLLQPGEGMGAEAGTQADRAATPVPGGHRSAQNVDAPVSGEGGDATGAVEFVLLIAGAHGVTLQDSPMNSPRVSQVQRIRTSRDRASWENRRATPNPDDMPFLASGEGRHRERRPVSRADASEGARVAPEASERGAAEAGTWVDGADGVVVPNTRRGTDVESPGRGILEGRGTRRREAARVAHGRPPVDEGPAATLAQYAGRVQDNQDAELLAGRLLQSIVDSSERSGPQRGNGVGGAGGGGAPGSGGSAGEGGRARAYGPGGGDYAALDTSDRRYRRWYLALRRKVENALRFPRERALAMDQGIAVYRLRVARDGRLRGAPRRIRSTGFADLDAAALSAIEQAAPFEPLPPELATGESFRVDLTVELSNPMIR